MPIPPGLSPKDADQVIRAVMDDSTNRLRVDATISPDGSDISIHHEDDSIAIGTPTELFTSTTIGPSIGLDVNVINPLPLEIQIDAASGDNIAIADQTGTNFVAVNPDGSLNITDNGGSITVDGTVTANQGTSPWVVSGTVTATPSGIQDVNIVSSIELEVKNDAGSPVPVTGTVAVTQSTSPWVVGDGGGSLTVDNNGTFAVQAAQSGAWSVNVNNAAGASAVNIQDGGNSITVDGTVAATQSGTWNINNITGTVSLPTGAATEATLATRLADATFTGRINTQGQKAMAASTPVVIASDQSPLVATASSVTTFNATTTSATVLAANSARKGASFYNDGGGVIYLKLGATASSTSYTVRMPDNTFYELPYPVYVGVIDAVSAAGTRSLRVTELT